MKKRYTLKILFNCVKNGTWSTTEPLIEDFKTLKEAENAADNLIDDTISNCFIYDNINSHCIVYK